MTKFGPWDEEIALATRERAACYAEGYADALERAAEWHEEQMRIAVGEWKDIPGATISHPLHVKAVHHRESAAAIRAMKR